MSRWTISRKRKWGLAARVSGLVAFILTATTILNNVYSTVAARIAIEENRKTSKAGSDNDMAPARPSMHGTVDAPAQQEPAAPGNRGATTASRNSVKSAEKADETVGSPAEFEVVYLLFPVATLSSVSAGNGVGASSVAAAYVGKPIVETEVFRYVIDENARALKECEHTPDCGTLAYSTLQVISVTWNGSEAATDVHVSLKGAGTLGSELAGDEVIEIGDLRPGEGRLVPIGYGPRMENFKVDREQVQRVYKPAGVTYKLAGNTSEASFPIRDEREHPTWIAPDLSIGEVHDLPDWAVTGIVITT